MPLPNAVIFDLDNTLSDATHRQHLVTGKTKQWDEFHKLSALDKPVPAVWAFLKMLKSHTDAHIIIVTGRPVKYADVTVVWLTSYDIKSDRIYMRPEGDFSHDFEYKERIFEELQKEFTIQLVMEDRDSVVKMVRQKLKLPCWQVKEGVY